MKKLFLVAMLCTWSLFSSAHSAYYASPVLRSWSMENPHRELMASFVVEKEEGVLVQDAQGITHTLPKSELSAVDKEWLSARKAWTKTINDVHSMRSKEESEPRSILPFVLFVIALGAASIWVAKRAPGKRVVWPALMLAAGTLVSAFTIWKENTVEVDTDPATIDEAFQPFVPAVHTFFDNTYFYVESRGIPETHEMMVGISNHGWQQQVPIPQCYIGNNAWPIPLHPVMAANPIPVDEVHFTRGAIAIAANGVPIFNVYTNTGVDSYVDGQLDNFGGHCGRADDYHYHIAPLHLYDYTDFSLPIAYGLDGFAVYGATEPDGSPMQPLDDNHGHVGADGVYHYHGTAEAPYMIARMAGEVTEDSTHQLIPQAAAHPVRPGLTPLNGALINLCIPNAAGNGYTLGYTLNAQQDSIVYSWTNNGQYTFNFYTTGDGVPNTQQYNGFDQCIVPVSVAEVEQAAASLLVYPNPCSELIRVNAPVGYSEQLRIYAADGRCVRQIALKGALQKSVDVSDCNAGTYYIECTGTRGASVQKVIKQ
jgi:Secretion system C-terminal sorting domain/YHYH protein